MVVRELRVAWTLRGCCKLVWQRRVIGWSLAKDCWVQAGGMLELAKDRWVGELKGQLEQRR